MSRSTCGFSRQGSSGSSHIFHHECQFQQIILYFTAKARRTPRVLLSFILITYWRARRLGGEKMQNYLIETVLVSRHGRVNEFCPLIDSPNKILYLSESGLLHKFDCLPASPSNLAMDDNLFCRIQLVDSFWQIS